MNKGNILLVDDDEVGLKNLIRLLSKEGYKVSGAEDGAKAISMLSKSEYDLVLTDLVMDKMSGMDVLAQAKQRFPDMEVIVVTGYASIPTAIEAIKKGAYHYLEKPFRMEEVCHLVGQALEKRALVRQVKELEQRINDDPQGPVIIGNSRAMTDVITTLNQVAGTELSVLVTGDSGTGKELAASLIHHNSRRGAGKFLAINCGAFAEELLANELFGHEKESFTGAVTAKPGLLESAGGGTLFLDEIGDMPLSMQVKLLRAIQEQEIIRVGGNQSIPIDVRIIAATNKDLKKAVSAGLFRNDLYYRLNVISIHIPSLAERKEDIPLLAYYFLGKACKKCYREVKSLTDEAMNILMEYQYPGNVRELKNIIERAVAITKNDQIDVCDLPPDLTEIEVYSFDHGNNKEKTLAEVEKEYIEWVLNKTGRNKTNASKALGIDRATLWRHLRRHEIKD